MRILKASCERARRWVSLRLDGELSELEGRLLESHLARCEHCRDFDLEVRELTLAVRAAALVPLSCPVSLPRRVRVGAHNIQLGAAAAASVAVVSLAAIAGLGGADRGVGPATFVRTHVIVVPAATDHEVSDLRALRRGDMTTGLPEPVASHRRLLRDSAGL